MSKIGSGTYATEIRSAWADNDLRRFLKLVSMLVTEVAMFCFLIYSIADLFSVI